MYYAARVARHPRDRFLTVYGRKPVLEVLEQPERTVARVFLAKGARGPMVKRIREAAERRGVEVRVQSAEQVSRISRRPKQDQGVAADVEAPAMGALEDFLDGLAPSAGARLLALDHVTTPANVGMILRTATVLGLDGVILPRRGVPEVGPLVIKASAGYAFRARILRCTELVDGLSAAKLRGFEVVGLSGAGAVALGAWAPRERTVLVLGNETDGVSEATRPLVDAWLRIPMAHDGDSLNVASAAAIVSYVAVTR
jgi:23S rRNA (guanosine2251-2'-O)-methyltransferase